MFISGLKCISSKVFDHRNPVVTPGGAKVHSLIGNTAPTVTIHQGHVKTQNRQMVFQNSIDDTAFSEQSFADLSLISGDVSVQIVEGAKRTKK